MNGVPKNMSGRTGKTRSSRPLSRPDQVTVSGLPDEADVHTRLDALCDGVSVRKSDVARNALIAGIRQFEADGYEVQPVDRIARKKK